MSMPNKPAIFFLSFEIVPTADNQNNNIVESGYATCFVRAEHPEDAYRKAKFFVEKSDWKIIKMSDDFPPYPIEVTEEMTLSADKEIVKLYRSAQKIEIAIQYVVSTNTGAETQEPIMIPHQPSYQFDLNNWLNRQKRLSDKGRCLHYENGEACNKISNAHSIQKSQALSSIAENGRVYMPLGHINKGIIYEKRGIETQASTFLGFCKKHDNQLFEPIDNSPLIPTEQQVFLYAYRSLCRELFVKQNAKDSIDFDIETIQANKAIKELNEGYKIGTEFSLNQLKIHKQHYDDSLKNKCYSDIQYTLFISKQKPNVVFSGLFVPDFDFLGRELQDLGNHASNLELITMCFAPMNNDEWGFLLAWHKTSSKVCKEFMGSLATRICQNSNTGDLLFRLIMSNCENIAFAPTWWDGLSEDARIQIKQRAESMVDLMTAVKPNYLLVGLEEIANWKFEEVKSNN
jgi:hypothetical protein